MKNIFMLLVLCLLLTSVSAGATDRVEAPGTCAQCGMDRNVFARTRVLITYTDGTTVGVCSLHCAADEMQKNKGRQVGSIMVADYTTTELTDARTAVWVAGGTKAGVMTSVPKWAFAKAEEARQFVQANGGRITTFEEVLKAANEELTDQASTPGDHQHMGHDMSHMGLGAQMVFNPAFGDDIYHTHPAGMWMANYRFMHTSMRGLGAGTSNVSTDHVIPATGTQYGFMMAPTEMTMDMHMVMVMYGLTDRLTLMGMANYQENRMEMLMNMGMGDIASSPMRTSGIGDTELRGLYQISKCLVGSLGLNIPTGDTKQEFTTMGMTFRAPYDMQLGSGTYDLKPALTYNALSDDALWNWGAQASYSYRTGKNNGYSLGDNVKVIGWLQRALGPASTWLRLAYNDTGRIKGRDPEIDKLLDPMMGASTPDADPYNYGGERLDGFVGASVTFGPLSLGVEGGIPLYQYLNGLQLKNDWYLTAGIQGMF